MHKILVVEDELNTRTAIVMFFQEQGFAVESAASAAEAIELAKSFSPTILISDWILGGEDDGVAVATQLCRDYPKLSVIFVSGYPLDGLRKQCQGLSVTAFLEKPLSLLDLNSAVEQAVNS